MRLSNVPSALTFSAVRLISNTKKEFIIRAELWHHSCASPLRNFFWREMMLHGTARKLVWDGRAVLGSLLALLGPAAALPLSLHLLDPTGRLLAAPPRPPGQLLPCLPGACGARQPGQPARPSPARRAASLLVQHLQAAPPQAGPAQSLAAVPPGDAGAASARQDGEDRYA